MHHLNLVGGASPPPNPPPPCGRGSARSTPVRGHARYGQPARATQNPGAQSARVARKPAGLSAHGFDAVQARRAQVFCARPRPGGRRAPGRCAVAGGRAFSAPWRRLRPVAAAPRGGVTAGAGGRGSHAGLVPFAAACGARLAPRPVPVLRAVRSTWFAPRPVLRPARPWLATASTPLASLRRRHAAGCAGGFTPPPARGSG